MLYELTNSQQRIWYLEKKYQGLPVNIIGGYKIIKGKVNIALLEKALHFFIKDNDSFQLRFVEEEEKVYQYVTKNEGEKIKYKDFSKADMPRDELEKWMKLEVENCFDMYGKLYDIYLFELSEDEIGIFLKLHHIIADGWSVSLMDKQVRKYYEAFVYKKKVIKEVHDSYIFLVDAEKQYLHSKYFEKNKMFWQKKLTHIPNNIVPANVFDAKGTRKCITLSGERLHHIKKVSDTYSCNVFFTAVYAIYLYLKENQTDMILGMPVFNRGGAKQKKIFGMYTNAMIFRFQVQGGLDVISIMKALKKEFFYCYANRQFPLNFLSEICDQELVSDLYNVCINCYNTELNTKFGDCEVKNYEFYSGYQAYAMQIVVKEFTDLNELQLMIDYKDELYCAQTIDSMIEDFITIIDQMTASPEKLISDFTLVTNQRKHNLVYDFNNTEVDNSKNRTIYELFEEQVVKTPDKIAISDGNRSITYLELNELANKVARKLVKNSVKKEEIVGILNTNSMETIVSILAVLKAGAAYLPIDAHSPIKRIEYILDMCQVKILFVNRDLYQELEFNGMIINCSCFYEKDVRQEKKNNLNIHVSNENLAYVIFTSGSTGNPKGVAVEEKGLVNYIEWAKKEYRMGEKDIMPFYSSIAFDLTVTSIFLPLISGGQIVVYSDERKNPIVQMVRENICTVVKLTPAHLNILKDMDLSGSKIRSMIVGGEELRTDLAEKVSRKYHGQILIYNEYGPTETVVGCMVHQYRSGIDTEISVPIGIPIDNMKIYILDENLKSVDVGEVGELYIAGEGVARGYLNNEKMTQERFVLNPFVLGSRMYRTGDLAKHLSSGLIDYIGRKDFQVKIRGFRIELGEIETRLSKMSEIKEAVITIEDFHNSRQLCAFIVKNENVSDATIHEYLSKYLPEYMIPVSYIEIGQIPINRNGKVDKKSLCEIRKENMLKKSAVEEICEEDEVNKEILKVFKSILNISEISIDDNFFYLGGDSIKAIQIVSKLDEMGYIFSIRDILVEPLMRNILSNIKKRESARKEIMYYETGTVKTLPIVSWFLDKQLAQPERYFQVVTFQFCVNIALEEIKAVLQSIMKYHDSFRLNLSNEELFYNDSERDLNSVILTYDLSEEPLDRQDSLIDKVSKNTVFDMQKECLFKVYIFDLGNNMRKVVFAAHHLIMDGVSWRILFEDFYMGIDCCKNNRELQFRRKTDSLKTWGQTLWKQKDFIIQMERDYWENVIDKMVSNRVDYPYKKDIEKNAVYIEKWFDSQITRNLLTKANVPFHTKMNELLICALILALKEFNQSDQVTINLEGHGRNATIGNVNIDRTLGWFTSIYPVSVCLTEEVLNQQIKQIKELLRNVPNGGIGFGVLRYFDHSITYQEQQQVNFNYLGDIDAYTKNELFKIEPNSFRLISDNENYLNYLIDINVFLIDEKLKVRIEYSKNLYKHETMRYFYDLFAGYVKDIEEYCVSKEKVEFTPSDFDLVDISMEDLDTLFA